MVYCGCGWRGGNAKSKIDGYFDDDVLEEGEGVGGELTSGGDRGVMYGGCWEGRDERVR